MNNILPIAVFLVIAFFLMAGGGGSPLHRLREKRRFGQAAWLHMSPNEAADIMKKETGYVIVDARTPEEYAAGHIPGAICVPYDKIEFERLEEIPNMEQPVFVYCQNGRRSRQAAEKLMVIGYKRVCEFGGFADWKGDVTTG